MTLTSIGCQWKFTVLCQTPDISKQTKTAFHFLKKIGYDFSGFYFGLGSKSALENCGIHINKDKKIFRESVIMTLLLLKLVFNVITIHCLL